VLMNVRHPVGGRENRLPHGPLGRGLAAPEHACEPEVLQRTRELRRAVQATKVIGPEAEGELAIVAVGPSVHEIVGHHDADFEIPRHVGHPGRGFRGRSGADAIAIHGQVRVQQSRYMLLTHRVHGKKRNQLIRVLVLGKNRAEVLPEALHAARDAV
jgi:hypothetical protein